MIEKWNAKMIMSEEKLRLQSYQVASFHVGVCVYSTANVFVIIDKRTVTSRSARYQRTLCILISVKYHNRLCVMPSKFLFNNLYCSKLFILFYLL